MVEEEMSEQEKLTYERALIPEICVACGKPSEDIVCRDCWVETFPEDRAKGKK